MTQKELLNLEHLKIAEIKPNLFLHIHTEEGWILTDWDNVDIKNYSGSICMYAPIRDEYADFRVITESEHNELSDRQKKAIEDEMKNV